MPRTKKRPAQRREVARTPTLAKELSAVKAQVEKLRVQCDNMSRTLVRLCCPPEWFKDDIDDAEVLSRMAEVLSFDNWGMRHARDDRNVPSSHSSDLAALVKNTNASVSLVITARGGHYDSMIREGIPRGIEWFQKVHRDP